MLLNAAGSESGLGALGNGGKGCVFDENVVLKIPGLVHSNEKSICESSSVLRSCIFPEFVEVE